jgi:hypothetical protein
MELYKEIKKSFPSIEKLFTKKVLSELSSVVIDDLEKYNFGPGTIIRLKLLRPKSALYKKFIDYGFSDKDKMTMEILKEYYKYKRYKT